MALDEGSRTPSKLDEPPGFLVLLSYLHDEVGEVEGRSGSSPVPADICQPCPQNGPSTVPPNLHPV